MDRKIVLTVRFISSPGFLICASQPSPMATSSVRGSIGLRLLHQRLRAPILISGSIIPHDLEEPSRSPSSGISRLPGPDRVGTLQSMFSRSLSDSSRPEIPPTTIPSRILCDLIGLGGIFFVLSVVPMPKVLGLLRIIRRVHSLEGSILCRYPSSGHHFKTISLSFLIRSGRGMNSDRITTICSHFFRRRPFTNPLASVDPYRWGGYSVVAILCTAEIL